MKALNLANGSTENKRRELDFYPTPPDVTHALMRFLDLEQCTIWEPACGDGAMAYVLPLTWRPDFMGGERGGTPTMEVHWTVWRRGQTDTKYRLLGRGV